MRRLLISFAIATAIAAAMAYTIAPTSAISNSIVISQVYGGGGNAGATLKNDFIELLNRGTSPQSLNGWSVQYAAAAGTSWQATPLTNVTLQPGQYYLIQESAGAGGTTNLPTPDATGGINMSATTGKIALVNATALLTGSGCPFAASVVDFVGFGSTANCVEDAGQRRPLRTRRLRSG
jgi:predicted extracellular nuclease